MKNKSRMPAENASVRDFVARLLANDKDFYADRVGYEQFCALNRAVWDAVHAAGPAVEAAVKKALRDRLAA